mmetsp:Transcript_68747/g.151410  ORF Transcript_68747/g.151410 Transcript_68747/m.151410 type:complete len:219 (+) Transcript_68747:296-952(+)
MVCNIPCCKKTRRGSLGPVDLDIASLIHVHLTPKEPSVWIVSDGNECRIYGQLISFSGAVLGINQLHMRQLFVLDAIFLSAATNETFHCRVPSDSDVGVVQDPLLQHQRGTEASAAMQEIYGAANASQHQGLLHGTVTTTDHGAGLSFVEVAVTSCAAGHSVTTVIPLALDMKPFAICPRGRDNRVSLHQPRTVGVDLHRLHGCVHSNHHVIPDLCIE